MARGGWKIESRLILRAFFQRENAGRPLLLQPFVWAFADVPFGFGLSLFRTTATLLVFLAVGAFGAQTMLDREVLVQASAPGGVISSCSGVITPLYAVDAALPIVDLRQEALCTWSLDKRETDAWPIGMWTIDWSEAALWTWAVAFYKIAGALIFGFVGIIFAGIFNPK